MRYNDEHNMGGVGLIDTEDGVRNYGLRIADCGSESEQPSDGSGMRHPPFGRPLRVMFMQTDMRIGGAEMVTANIIRRLDRERFTPELCCLKHPGVIGEELTHEIPVHHDLLHNKYDLRVLPRLISLLKARETDAVITVGAGDKMFWGRIAARRLGLPVIISALHSTGWPDGVGRLNRMLTPITDAFIAVAAAHGQYLMEHEGFPARRVVVIPNGVDTTKFAPMESSAAVRYDLGIDADAPVAGIVAALRPEKNHELFLEMARRVVRQRPESQFVIIGDGLRRDALVQRTHEMGLENSVHFLGSRNDVPRLLAALDVFVLTSHVEANPISILEAMSAGRPVVATDVGSIHEAVAEGKTGYLVPAGDVGRLADRVLTLFNDSPRRQAMGAAARRAVVEHWSIASMVGGYEDLIESIYASKQK